MTDTDVTFDCVEINPTHAANRAIIWLHGLGANGNDFSPLVPHLQTPEGTHVRFVFPHAPQIPVTINGGMRMPAWYDIIAMNFEREVDVAQLSASATRVHRLIEREIERGIKAEHIIIAGFSQGGAVAYQAALSYPQRLGGLLALSTYFATASTVKMQPAQHDLPILVQHGTQDPVVPEALGQRAIELLQEKNLHANYQSFPMQHQVSGEQVVRINEWLLQVLK